jgi:hypothetical protein
MDFDVLRTLVGLTDVLEINYHSLRWYLRLQVLS